MVHKCERGLLLGWWWPVGSKLLFDRWQHQSRKLLIWIVVWLSMIA
jgi:hypothetical protein